MFISASLLASSLSAATQPPAPSPRRSRDPAPWTSAERYIDEHASPAEARRHLRRLTETPHVAGSDAERNNAHYVRDTLISYGFTAELVEYEALLPWPRTTKLALTAPESREFSLREAPHREDKDSWDEAIATYNAYSASGTVEAPVVYAHYGRAVDFEWLEAKGVDVRGSVCLMRYGKGFRGLKVREAAARGAVAALLYSDPDDDGYRRGDVGPDGPWRPKTAVQRGSILYLSEMVGDPTTPGRPSKPGVERLEVEDCPWLPTIPCLPISAATAEPILAQIHGPNVSRDWQGGCAVTYHTGPGPARVRMEVDLDDELRPVINVMGRLRTPHTNTNYILIGGHRDAWVHGAIDPCSGQALGLEAMRLLGKLVADGWEPRFEIRFASWDAEEFGLIGSTEWCEDFADDIQKHCLAYINCDGAVSGTRFGASATPDLVSFLAEVAARTTPHDRRGRLLTRWAHGGSRPPVGNLGSGSDYTAFVCRLGVPSLDFGSRGGHGVYHSSFDTLFTMEQHIDPGFEIHASMARFLAIAAHRFASSERPPIDTAAWAPWLESAIGSIPALPDELRNMLLDKVATLRASIEEHSPLSQKSVRRFRRATLHIEGIEGRPWFRNLLVAPDIDLGYGAATLPELREAVESEDAERIDRASSKLVEVLDAMLRALQPASRR